MTARVRLTILALGLSFLAACATPALTPASSPLPPSATPPTVADANNPQDSPDYVVMVMQSGPPRWIYSLRYAGNFVLTAPNVLPKTDFTSVILHAAHDVSHISVEILSATPGRLPSGTPSPTLPAVTILPCSTTDIRITSQDPGLGWQALTIAVTGNSPNVVYFGFGQACNSYSSAALPKSGWAGPVAGP